MKFQKGGKNQAGDLLSREKDAGSSVLVGFESAGDGSSVTSWRARFHDGYPSATSYWSTEEEEVVVEDKDDDDDDDDDKDDNRIMITNFLRQK